ncbi:MAG: SRPBCC family protein [Acidimicrobiales bacterium]|jgi:ribosome-associated toxin RatA of RatAB toxin-antitoxin module|nr:SRPBCC family protein [Acidimicrobiales bacterium]
MRDHTSQTTVIQASPRVCFDVALDFERYPEWAADIKDARIVVLDDEGRGGEVEFRAAAMGRSSTYRLRYNYGSNPLRLSWRLVEGDLERTLDGEYVFAPVADDPDATAVTYELTVELKVPLPGFVRRRAEAKIIHTALDDLKQRAESLA